jgi:hypothetical protein
VLFSGVGFHHNIEKYIKFLNKIQKEVDCEFEVFKWSHDYMSDSHDDNHVPDNDKLKYGLLRGWFSEIVLDLQHVLYNANEMELPDADVYLGHSAGSILALAKAKNKHCILFGSPLALIANKDFPKDGILNNCVCESTKILNIIHQKDIIAYPIEKEDTENFYIKSNIFSLSRYSPLTAHGDYWGNKHCINKVIKQLKEWS